MGGKGSGGANGGPQYNPANVSGTGGAGQSGNYTGFGYGQESRSKQPAYTGKSSNGICSSSNTICTHRTICGN